MLSSETLAAAEGIDLADVRCRHGRGRGEIEQSSGWGIAFVRRGCFVHDSAAGRRLLDASTAFFFGPGIEHRYDHPHDGGDDCTALLLEPETAAAILGGDPTLPSEPVHSPPALDLRQRALLAAARRGADPGELTEAALALAADLLERRDPGRVQAGRPATRAARRRLVDGAREALAAEPDLSLTELGRLLATSPHHLSRQFRALTGHTVSRHRMRLRARAALDRLAGGEADLARLAADLGFADQSHLCRVLRDEAGDTPSALRETLGAGR